MSEIENRLSQLNSKIIKNKDDANSNKRRNENKNLNMDHCFFHLKIEIKGGDTGKIGAIMLEHKK